MDQKIAQDLDSLLSRARQSKTAALKEAETKTAAESISAKLDAADDGTSPATTGAQAAASESAQKEQYPEPAVDVGAKDSQVGQSVEMSTDGATAVATDGQEGTEGADLDIEKEADNGEEKPENKVDGNGGATGAFKEASASFSKIARELKEAADSLLTPLDRFLVKSARASDDKAFRKIAMGMDDAELADAAGGSLMGQVDAGELGDEEAAAILQEALASGAITEEDIAQAVAEMEGGGMPPGAAAEEGVVEEGLPGGGAVAEEIAGEAIPMEGGGEEMIEDEGLEAKLAMAQVGPDKPDAYIRKLAQHYSAEVDAGYAYGMQLAERLNKQAEDEEAEEETEEASEKSESAEGKAETEVAEAAASDAPVNVEEAGEVEVEVPAPMMAPGPEMGAALPQPATPEEAAALQAVMAELGLDEAGLAALMNTEAAPMDKMAAAKASYRAAILNKVAALQR